MQLVEDGDVSHKGRKLYTWIFVVECIRIISIWTSIEPELGKDSKGSGLLRDGAHLRTAEEGGEAMDATEVVRYSQRSGNWELIIT